MKLSRVQKTEFRINSNRQYNNTGVDISVVLRILNRFISEEKEDLYIIVPDFTSTSYTNTIKLIMNKVFGVQISSSGPRKLINSYYGSISIVASQDFDPQTHNPKFCVIDQRVLEIRPELLKLGE